MDVTQLWRYPVKSMIGQQVDEVELHETGVVGDRTWATRDLDKGGIRGAKKMAGLMQMAARDIGDGEYIGTFAGPEARRDGVYVLWVYESEDRAVGRSGRNLLRYVNHASPCNAEFEGFDLYATCVISRDDEITIDYGGES